MAITSITSGQFDRFVKFAEKAGDDDIVKAGDVAVKKDDATFRLEERDIKVKDDGDSIGKWIRHNPLKQANDEIRELFHKSVAEIFGGEANIPESVKDAMKLKDYGHGKPLSARRIKLVNAAIIKYETDQALKDVFGDLPAAKLSSVQEKLVGLKLTKADFGRINLAANYYAALKGVTQDKALDAVLTKGTPANDALLHGTTYMKDKDSFQAGMESAEKMAAGTQKTVSLIRNSLPGGLTKQAILDILRSRLDDAKAVFEDAKKVFGQQKAVGEKFPAYQKVVTRFKTLTETLESHIAEFENLPEGQVDTAVEKKFYNQGLAKKEFGYMCEEMQNLSRAMWKQDKDVSITLNLLSTTYTAVYEPPMDAYRDLLLEREGPALFARLEQAAKESGKQLPSMVQLKSNLMTLFRDDPYSTLANFNGFIDELKDLKTAFTAEEKEKFADAVKQQHPKIPSMTLENLIRQMERCITAEAFRMRLGGNRMPTNGLAKFLEDLGKNPNIIATLKFGFNVAEPENKEKLVKLFEKKLTETFDEEMQKDITSATSLKLGYLPQSVREYVKGHYTVDGENIGDGHTNKNFFKSDSPERQGYCEYLEKTFDDKHIQMRRAVSMLCGMESSLGGVIDQMLSDGVGLGDNDTGLLKNKPLTEYSRMPPTVTALRGQFKTNRDNYDISVDAETGDVTIRMKHVFALTMSQYMDDKYNTTAFGKSNPPVLGLREFNATIVIKNQSDEELGEKMPAFEIKDFTQKETYLKDGETVSN